MGIINQSANEFVIANVCGTHWTDFENSEMIVGSISSNSSSMAHFLAHTVMYPPFYYLQIHMPMFFM